MRTKIPSFCFVMWTSINLPYDSDLGSEGKAEDIPPWRTKIDNLEWVKKNKVYRFIVCSLKERNWANSQRKVCTQLKGCLR